MELQQDSIIVSTRIEDLFNLKLSNYFTHVFVTDGECVMKYSGEQVKMGKGDCVIIVANHLVTEIHPTEDFHAKIIFIEPGFMDVCTPHTSYGIVGGMTMVIYSHGFGGSHSGGAAYARALAARGYMVYCFDFCGATSSSRSDGATTDMSIRTEKSDLRAVIGHFAEDSRVDASRIYLVGASQGGMVTAMSAADFHSKSALRS